jgi:hypothetical protein
LQIDPARKKILNTVNLTTLTGGSGCVGVRGMAVGPDHQLAIGCNGGTGSVIISEDFSSNSTTVIAALPGENGTDEVWYNPGDNHYFFANGGHSPPQLGVVDAAGEGSGLPAEDFRGRRARARTRWPPIRPRTGSMFRSTRRLPCSPMGGLSRFAPSLLKAAS